MQPINKNQGSQDLSKALFYAIKSHDFKHAFFLVSNGAPICKSYEISKDQWISTISLLVKILSQAAVEKGYQTLSYKIPDRLLDIFLKIGIDLRCHCSKKFMHRCPLFIALKELKIQNEEEIFQKKNILVRKLIINGATIRKHYDDKRTYNIPWFDVEQIKSYLITSQQSEQVAKQEKLQMTFNQQNQPK